nr:acyltransferase family protein [Micromonospora sp. DSM 115978]
MDWYLHLWFLIVLLAYAFLAPAVMPLVTRLTATRAYQVATAGRWRAMASVVLFVLVATAVLRVVRTELVGPVLGAGFHAGLVRHALDFVPFFVLGLVLFVDKARLLSSFQRPAPILLAAAGLVLLAAWRDWIDLLSVGTGRVLVEAAFAIPLLATVFALAQRLTTRPGSQSAFRYLADASYTVYLMHFFWIYIFATLLSLDPGLGAGQMLLVVVATFGVTFAIHHYVVLRKPVLRKIFNGKFPPKARRQTAEPAAVPLVAPPALQTAVPTVVPAVVPV